MLTMFSIGAVMTAFPHLFTPLRIGAVELPNRIVMGSMHTGLEDVAEGFPRLARFYAERARGGAALIVTGGFSPNREGRFDAEGRMLASEEDLPNHRIVTEAVHAAGGRILLQILHTGRYGAHDACVAPSALRAPINRYTPREMSEADILRTIDDFARCAYLAQAAGYDGVEVMASEGYLLNEFVAPRTNKRRDRWGGALENRIRFPVEVVRRIRESAWSDFLVMVRISLLDLVEEGSPWEDVEVLARTMQEAGADLLNTGIGWHEARVPTIAHMVPRAAWSFATARLKQAVTIPVVASNRFNTPEAAEAALAAGGADMVSMARPFLADPALPNKAKAGQPETVNTCIGCNQACLDYIFVGKVASCLVNPRAGHEADFITAPVKQRKRVAVVGAGPAGLACATEAAARGHAVTLFEAAADIGGQFQLARRIPGKADYAETIRYFRRRLADTGVAVRLETRASADDLAGFETVVLASGIVPRRPDISGIDHPAVVSYVDVLTGARAVGERVAIVGCGGIGFDTALYLLGEADDFFGFWGIDREHAAPGGLRPPAAVAARRRITMLQRKPGKPGAGLGKTTGWVHRAALERQGVQFLAGVDYRRIDDAGLHVEVAGEERLIAADTIVVCAGQEPLRDLAEPLMARGVSVQVIGGAERAAELDARRAIEQGTRLGLTL